MRRIGSREAHYCSKPASSRPRLTRRQLDVLELLCQRWYSNKEIACKLHISEKCVSHHMAAVLSRTGLRNRYEARDWALQSYRRIFGRPRQ